MMNVNRTIPSLLGLLKNNNFALRARSLLSRRPWSSEIGLLLSLGENLAYFQPPVPKCEGAMVDNCVNCREMVQRWYDEVKNYDFDKGGPKLSLIHI